MEDLEKQVPQPTIVEGPVETCSAVGSRLSIISASSERITRQNTVRNSKWFKIMLWIVVPLILLGVLVAAVYYVSKSQSSYKTEKSSSEKCASALAFASQMQNMTNATDDYGSTNTCKFSAEATRVELGNFFTKVKNSYYEFHPQNVIWKAEAEPDEKRNAYRPFDPRPSAIKQKTDAAIKLLDELDSITKNYNEKALSTREKKGVHEARHFLQHAFGTPYDGNYYTGDWLLGPNNFCWQDICYLFHNFQVGWYKPITLAEVEELRQLLERFKDSILQYIENLKTGVKSGMVRSIEACQAGLNAIKRNFPSVIHSETGIRHNYRAAIILDPKFVENISSTMKIVWAQKHGEELTRSLKRYVVDYLGKPLHALIRYLEHDHMRHCVPSNVSSGLGSLPLPYVYVDGKPDITRPTIPTLPTGERLNGSELYRGIMPYFTASPVTPDEITKQANVQLKQLYAEAVEVAKQMTGKTNEVDAVRMFRETISSRGMFFNNESFPANESDENAFEKCSNDLDASLFCPKRWKAMQEWIKSANQTMGQVKAKLSDSLFYLTGPKRTAPECPVEVKPDFSPSVSYHHYHPSSKDCPTKAIHFLPFFLENYGPRYSEWTTTAHETLPGHHMEVQGYTDNFEDECPDDLTWLSSLTYYASFSEGWATYAESPVIASDTDSYINEPMNKYGMINHQIMTMLRAIIDVGLHSGGMSREEALELFDKYAWETSDLASKEVTRYQSSPGQATAYIVGQSAVMKARKLCENCLGEDFSLPEFHYQILRQGEIPLEYLQQNINKYVHCTLDTKSTNCQDVNVVDSSLSGHKQKLPTLPHRRRNKRFSNPLIF